MYFPSGYKTCGQRSTPSRVIKDWTCDILALSTPLCPQFMFRCSLVRRCVRCNEYSFLEHTPHYASMFVSHRSEPRSFCLLKSFLFFFYLTFRSFCLLSIFFCEVYFLFSFLPFFCLPSFLLHSGQDNIKIHPFSMQIGAIPAWLYKELLQQPNCLEFRIPKVQASNSDPDIS